MEVIVAKTSGFCFGIKNAVSKAEEQLNREKEVYCLGELTHNNRVLSKLEEKGLVIIKKLSEVPNNKKMIIRAHGEPKITCVEARKRGIEIIDLTCPKVLKIHEIIEEYSDKNYFMLIIGESGHPEVVGEMGYAKLCKVVQTEEDLYETINYIKENNIKNILVISQTTFSMKKFDELQEIITKELQDVNIEIKKTICDATQSRQTEAEILSKQVEAIIIIGGKNSSNTKKLYEISKKNNENSVSIEDYKELDLEYMKQFNKIGVIAGASTPDESIEEVVDILRGE